MGQQVITSSGLIKGLSGPSYGTSLPSSPVDGQEAILVDSTTIPTYQWRFRYNASSANTDKWEFVGGVGSYTAVETSQQINSITYVDLATVLSFTVPRGGQYILAFGANVTVQQAAGNNYYVYTAPKIGAAATADADACNVRMDSTTGSAAAVSYSREKQFTIAASDVIKLQHRQTTAAAFNASGRWLRVTPIRVS